MLVKCKQQGDYLKVRKLIKYKENNKKNTPSFSYIFLWEFIFYNFGVIGSLCNRLFQK